MTENLRVFRIDRAGKFNPDLSSQVSQSLSSAVSTVEAGTTFVVRATDSGSIERFFVSGGTNSADRAFQIAKTFSSKSVEAEPPELDTRIVAQLRFVKDSFLYQSTQAGTTLTAVADTMDNFLAPGEWIAVTIRKTTKKERARWNTWHEFHRPGSATAHSRRGDAVIASIYAGSYEEHRARNAVNQFVSSLGGFEISAEAVILDAKKERHWMKWAAGISAAVGAAATAGRSFAEDIREFLGGDVFDQVAEYLPTAQMLSVGAASAFVLLALLHRQGYLPSKVRSVKQSLRSGLAPAPEKRSAAPKPPRQEKITRSVVEGQIQESIKEKFDGDYPLAPTTFMLGSELATAILLPGQGAKSGVSSTMSRDLPSSVVHAFGPELGDCNGQVAKLSAADMWGGIFVIGKPGSGKSKLMEWLWAWKQAHLALIPELGANVMNGSMVAFDTKGDSTLSESLASWSEKTGVRTNIVRIGSDNPLPLNVFDTSGSLRQQTEKMLDALAYLVGDAAGPRFRETAGIVLPLAMLVDNKVTLGSDWLPEGASAFQYAHILTGSMGFDKAKELFLLIRERHGNTPEVEAGVNLFGDKVSDSAFKTLVESTRNKLSSLGYTENFWCAARSEKAVDWKYILEGGKSVVFDFAGLSERAVSDLAQLLMFTLRAAIEKHCAGFESQGRSVSILADEASVIAEHSNEVVDWLREKGRSFGVEVMFATQQPRQIPESVRASLLGYATKIVFSQSDAKTLRELAVELSTGGESWAEEDIKNLPRYSAIVSTEVDKESQPSFTVAVPDFTGRDPKVA